MNTSAAVKEIVPLRRSRRSAVRKRPLSLRSLTSALLGLAMLASATPLLAQTANTTTKYTYDALDRLTQVTDPSGLNTTYQYDGLSDPTGLTSPDTGVTARTYDAAGNVLTATDAKGVLVTYTYDAQNRRLSASYTDATQNIAYHYDEANSVTGCSSSYPIGHLTRIVENAVTTVYCYDAQGRVIEKQQIVGTTTDTTGYAYTSAGRLSGVVYPSGTLVTYTRDSDGRIQSLSVTPPHGTASTAVSSVTYQPFGPVSGYTLGNGQAVTRSYDANYRLTDLTSPAFSLHVARDAMGDITAIGNAPGANPATETYSYDPLYRLTAITEAGGSTLQSVTYNPTGDRLSKTGSGLATGNYSYNPNTHQLAATGSYARSVDANGNTTAITAASGNLGFGYNDRNRLAVAQLAGSTVGSYTYDALGERIAKVSGSASERYAYGEGRQLLSEQGATNRDYVWMDGIPVANVDTTGTTSTLAYVTADQLGTPRAISNASGTTIWRWAYQSNAWGEVAPTGTGYSYNLRLPGQYYDAETGLVSNGFRDCYEPATGRYCQSDPTGLAGGISTYAYGFNNPLMYVDPLGLRPPTPSEIAFLKSFFGKCFNAQQLDVNKRLFGSRAWSPFDHHVNLPGSDFIDGNGNNSVNTGDPYIGSVLAHETLHTWQRDQGGNVTTSEIVPQISASLGGSDPYSYNQSINDPAANLAQFQALFNSKNYEAQAQMWQDYVYSALTGGDVSKWSQIVNYVQSTSSCGCKQ